ncbi:MAG TPA: lytic transglycosylase domain-containing protein [Bacteriovoracaceae bacterium]|nr:lytic transglycosylase domain-containing protein [Bacteriovoracaceae bacterium]
MKFFLLSIFFSFHVSAAPEAASGYESLVNNDKLLLTRADHVLAENLVSMIRFTEKGYINQDVLNKVLSEAEKSKHFTMFVPWLKSVQQISKMSSTAEFILYCRSYTERKEKFPLERKLERTAGNYCRERTLEAIGRDIDKTSALSEEAVLFIQENLKFFLTKKNKKNFAFFLQSQSGKPEILKKLSQEVTTYSVLHEVVPAQDVLKDILINEQITKLIQDKGFSPLQNKNVFYAEYGKLIEVGYKTIDNKSPESKIKDHYGILKNYLDLNQDYLPVGLCLTRMNDFSKSVFRAGHKDLSREIFRYIVKKNNKEIHEDALFFYLWTYIYTNEFSETLKLAKELNLLKSDAHIQDPRLRFWIAFSYERTDQVKQAIPYYEHIVSNSPLSYYGIMSAKKLQLHKPESTAVSFYSNNALKSSQAITIDLAKLEEDHLSSLVRLKAWAKIDTLKMLKLELKRLKTHSMPTFLGKHPEALQLSLKSDLHLINAYIIQDSENHLATFRYLYEVLDKKEVVFNRSLLEVLYPRPYLEVLNRTLKNASLDPIVVLSLIRQESVFNPLARSPVGARGLMQLMPMTARRMRKSTQDKHLVNPQINIEIGTKYFSNLLKRYDGNLVYVLSAYNAGESRVERWKNLYFDTDETILKNIEAIPFLETRNYVKLIFRNIFFYKLLIEKNEIADSGQPNKIFDVSLGFKR